MVKTSDFDYSLPPELIAQHPSPERDQSRLLVLDRQPATFAHHRFADLPTYLRAGDVLVLNNSRVIPARLRGRNLTTGGAFELLLLEENKPNDWWVMLRPGKRARVGARITLHDHARQPTTIFAQVTAINPEGHRRLLFTGTTDIRNDLDRLGEVPLPPYIHRAHPSSSSSSIPPFPATRDDHQRYQTVYADPSGSVAAPTAGLHFTTALLDQLRARGVIICFVTLHVGLGTFAPVKSDTLAGHVMHEERYELPDHTASIINHAKAEQRRVIAVGTTVVRVLESSAQNNANPDLPLPPNPNPNPNLNLNRPRVFAHLTPHSSKTRIFIHPPYPFRIIDALVTNFHLPRSTLLMLVAAFAAPGELRGRDLILAAYAEAIRHRYRFYSYGDAMLIL